VSWVSSGFSAAEPAGGATCLRANRRCNSRAAVRHGDHEYTLVDTRDKLANLMAELRKQNLISVDTETTSVNAMRADLVGVSLCWQTAPGVLRARSRTNGFGAPGPCDVRRELGPILADEKVRKIGQNVKYDWIVLRNARMPLRGVYFDTMVASYCLDPERTSHSLDNLALDFLGHQSIPIESLIGKARTN